MTKQSQINAGLKSQLLRISEIKRQCEYWNERFCWEYSSN